MLADLPLCGRVIRAAHEILLSGRRGAGKAPGEYRRTPNWIGPPGSGIENARYVPIGPEHLVGALSRWEQYLHEDTPDLLVQAAVIHAEFEALHPFLDGNGRLGRMLIPLFLWQRGLIQRPVFYISEYLEARRDAYYDGLLAVSRDGGWTDWCRFFLQAVRVQADENLARTQAVLDLYNELKDRVAGATRSCHAARAQDWMFRQPIFSSAAFVRGAGIPRPSAHRILNQLKRHGILRQILPGRGNQPGIFSFPALLESWKGPACPEGLPPDGTPVPPVSAPAAFIPRHFCRLDAGGPRRGVEDTEGSCSMSSQGEPFRGKRRLWPSAA